MKKELLRPLFVVLFFLLILSPLFLMPFSAPALGRGFQREFSIMLGFVGLTMAGWQLAPIARFGPAQKLYNLDRLYRLHHILSAFSALFVTVHYLLLLFNFDAGFSINDWALELLNIFTSPLVAQLAVISLLGYILITVTSIFRKAIALDYDVWRILHDIFTVLIVAGGLSHILLVGQYSAAPAMKALLWAQTALWILAALYIRIIKPMRQLRRPYKVVEVREEIETVFTLALEPQGFALPKFHPGEVAWLTVRESPFSLSRHPFSVASSVHNKSRFEFAIKELGDFTNTIRDLTVGEIVYVDGPFGYYDVTVPENKGIVLVAGGIGVAPAMSVLRSMADAHDPRPAVLFYGNMLLEQMAFAGEIKQLEKTLPNFKSVPVIERPPLEWKGYSGYITADVMRRELPVDYKEYSYFVCGPLPMMAAIRRNLVELEVPNRNLHYEEFTMA